MPALTVCLQKVGLIVHDPYIITNYYCPQKVGLIVPALICIVNYCPKKVDLKCVVLKCPPKVVLIVRGPYIYYQLLSSESGPQFVRPLIVLRKWASLCAALTYV